MSSPALDSSRFFHRVSHSWVPLSWDITQCTPAPAPCAAPLSTTSSSRVPAPSLKIFTASCLPESESALLPSLYTQTNKSFDFSVSEDFLFCLKIHTNDLTIEYNVRSLQVHYQSKVLD
ncbi:hypothetical protein AMECASPLE_034610 [Ameca splendens]|uniref:Uncharacterized protein n=1 Tax=Ameca splendens TaxID=208324 RepID=A0ABV0YUE9_9TELE